MQKVELGSTSDTLFAVYTCYSEDQQVRAVFNNQGSLYLEDVPSGNIIRYYPELYNSLSSVVSPNGKTEAHINVREAVDLIDMETGEIRESIPYDYGIVSAAFSPDGKTIVTTSDINAKYPVFVWRTEPLSDVFGIQINGVLSPSAVYSPDGKIIAVASLDGLASLWDASTGRLIRHLEKRTNIKSRWWGNRGNTKPCFSPDGKQVVTASVRASRVWEVETGKLLHTLSGHSDFVKSISYSPDGKYIATSSTDSRTIVWDAQTGDMLYTLIIINDNDYLVYDKDYRFDGTPNARKLLYLTCGTEVIELDQLKDQLWVPGLVDRLLLGEPINSAKLSDLDICNFIPIVSVTEVPEENSSVYKFSIQVRRGGLSDVVVSINGIEWKRFANGEIDVKDSTYLLSISESEIRGVLNVFSQNTISVQAFSEKDRIGSKVITVTVVDINRTRTFVDENGNVQTVSASPQSLKPPVMYAVVVGVSDYKGDSIDLVYPARDAKSFSKTLQLSASKLLSFNGQEGTVMYTLNTDNTDTTRYGFPDKITIRKVFEEIGTKAEPQDILLIFFAGHGVTKSEDKSFSFITANASQDNYRDSTSGITTKELFEWIQPQYIKAQKRVLIFDACHSGQAITDMVSIGEQDQGFVAARSLDDLEYVKALDKLKEQSGLTILSASTSDQLAWERFTFGGGILTYALLKSVKSDPNILDDDMLNIGRWFDAAKNTVEEVSQKYKISQNPQVMSTNNFNIGIVDDSVRSTVILPKEKPVISSTNFQEEEEMDDVLGLNKLVDDELSNVAKRSIDSPITFFRGGGMETWKLSGRYTLSGNDVKLKVSLRQPDRVKHEMDFTGTKDMLKKLTDSLVAWTLEKMQPR